jgi:hypothetical protein
METDVSTQDYSQPRLKKTAIDISLAEAHELGWSKGAIEAGHLVYNKTDLLFRERCQSPLRRREMFIALCAAPSLFAPSGATYPAPMQAEKTGGQNPTHGHCVDCSSPLYNQRRERKFTRLQLEIDFTSQDHSQDHS